MSIFEDNLDIINEFEGIQRLFDFVLNHSFNASRTQVEYSEIIVPMMGSIVEDIESLNSRYSGNQLFRQELSRLSNMLENELIFLHDKINSQVSDFCVEFPLERYDPYDGPSQSQIEEDESEFIRQNYSEKYQWLVEELHKTLRALMLSIDQILTSKVEIAHDVDPYNRDALSKEQKLLLMHYLKGLLFYPLNNLHQDQTKQAHFLSKIFGQSAHTVRKAIGEAQDITQIKTKKNLEIIRMVFLKYKSEPEYEGIIAIIDQDLKLAKNT